MSAAVVPTPGGGDCLFAAVAMALLEPPPVSSPPIDKTALRRAVAARALDPADAEFTAALRTWALLWSEAVRAGGGAAHEFAHAAPLARAKTLTPEVRAEIYKAMMDPRIYWGEEMAVATLERALSIRIWVYQKRDKGEEAALFREGVSQRRDGRRDVLLLLDVVGQHYSLLRRVT